MRVEIVVDGKIICYNYYFINYCIFVNVVKYKLDYMRRRIEIDERDLINWVFFKCFVCCSIFIDLEVNQFFDFMIGIFCCIFCYIEVEEDELVMFKKDVCIFLVRFNE